MVNVIEVKKMLHKFLNQDDTNKNLLETLNALTRLRAKINTRLSKVDKELDVIRKIFVQHEELQQKN